MSRFNHKPAGSMMRRPRYAAIQYMEGLIAQYQTPTNPIYSAMWDITQPGGALDVNGVAVAHIDSTPIASMPQLLPSGTGTALTPGILQGEGISESTFAAWQFPTDYQIPVLRQQTYRRGVINSLQQQTNPRIPMIYKPAGYWANMVTPLSQHKNDPIPSGQTMAPWPAAYILSMFYTFDGNLAIPTGWVDNRVIGDGLTFGFIGCRTIHGEFPDSIITAMGGTSTTALDNALQYPAPDLPGSMIVRYRKTAVVGDSNIAMDFFVNGVMVNTKQMSGTAIPPSGGSPDPSLSIISSMGMFCWATQKLFAISIAMTDTEITELHKALIGTMEVWN